MKISWVFDVISPFAYLSLKQLPQLPPQIEVEYVPILFAALLNHHGQLGNAEIPPKRRFTYRFALWRARRLGIEMRMPPAHPFSPLAALRLIVAAGSTRRAIETVFDAVFREGVDVADPRVIERLTQRLAADGAIPIERLRAAASAADTKQRLRDNTQWALEHGIFGVPTFVVGGEIFWGHDSFEMMLDYLRDEAAFEDEPMKAIENLPVGVQRPRPS